MHKIKALQRYVIFQVFSPWVIFKSYSNPKQVGGYLGWYEFRGKTIVFVKDNGKNQYYW